MAGDRELYVYALAEPGMPQRQRILGHALRTLPIGQVHVVVARRSERPEATTDALREQHAIVMALAARSNALLPARFGSVIGGAALRSKVTAQQSEILRALALVRGRSQMTVRVFGTPDRSQRAGRTSTGTAFLESRRELARYIPAEVASIREALGEIVKAERVEPGERGVRVTVLHLVARGTIETYRRRAEALQLTLAPHRVRVTGPWPAFAFAPELF